MKATFKIIIAGFLILSTVACRCDQHCHVRINGNGRITEQEYALGYFKKIHVYETIRIHFTVADTHSIKVKAESNVLNHIKVVVSSGVLTIKYKEGVCVNADGIDVYITAPSIQELESDGTTYVDGTVAADDLTIVNNGTMDMSLAGKISKLSIRVNGTCDFDLYEAQVTQAYVKCNGTTRGKINVSEKLEVVVNGTTTLRYKGNPAVTQTINGTGKIINDN